MYHRKTRWMRWLTLSLEAMISALGPLTSQYTGKSAGTLVEIWNRFFLILWWKSFFKHYVSQHRKDRNLSRKCTINLIRRQNHNGEVVDRSWLCFSPSQTCVKCFIVDWCARIRLNVRISLLEKESATGSTLLSVWGATSI